MTGTALYVYCLAPAGRLPGPPAATGLDGAALRTVHQGGLVAVVHDCDPAPYGGEVERVKAWVLAHDGVVEEVWTAAGSVLPMSFDVIVRATADRTADDNLRSWLAAAHDALLDRLAALAGRVELKAHLARAVAEEPPGPVPRGREFFTRQGEKRRRQEEQAAAVAMACQDHLEALRPLVDDVRLLQSRPEPGTVPVLSAALLCRPEAVSRVGAYLEEVRREPAMRVRFTGPWPPYSFAGDLAEPATPPNAPEEETT